MNEAVQMVVVGIVVMACLWRVVKRYAPKVAWQWQAKLSYLLEQAGRPGWLRAVGQWLRPTAAVAAEGCGSGCGPCRGCPTGKMEDDPLRIQLRS